MEKIDLKSLAEGTHSKVLAYGERNNKVALKVVSSVNKRECVLLKNEFKVLQMLRHPNIIEAFKLK